MKRIILWILLVSGTVYGQTQKEIHFPKHRSNGDTSLYYKENAKRVRQLHLKRLESSNDKQVFRFWNDSQVIEVERNRQITGRLIDFIYTYKEDDWKNGFRNRKIISSKHSISSEQANAIFNKATVLGLFVLPTGDSIPAWQTGVDGITYKIEYSTPAHYHFKTYWTPKAQDSIPEAITLLNFIDFLEKELKLKEKRQQFIATLDKGQYTWGGMERLVIRRKKRAKR